MESRKTFSSTVSKTVSSAGFWSAVLLFQERGEWGVVSVVPQSMAAEWI